MWHDMVARVRAAAPLALGLTLGLLGLGVLVGLPVVEACRLFGSWSNSLPLVP